MTPDFDTRGGSGGNNPSRGDGVKKGPIAYMASNHVAANIAMLVLILGGIWTAVNLKQEVFPEFQMDMVRITMVYPGATPTEVEESIIQPIELAVSAVDDIKRISATATESAGAVILEVMEGANPQQVLQDARSEIDRIQTFPIQAEEPLLAVMSNRQEVMLLAVHGTADEMALTKQAERIRDDLLTLDNITQVELAANRPYEVAIEVPEQQLRKYNLTLPRIAQIVRQASIDMAGGKVRTEGGEVLVRVTEKRLTGAEFDSVVVFTAPTGERVFLNDIATVRDTFEDVNLTSQFDGERAVLVRVFRVGEQKPTEIARDVREYVEQRNEQLPESVQLAVYMDWSEVLQGRINLLVKNGMLGLILVLIILALFLEIRLALWVAAGIAITFLGSMIVLPWFDVSINMLSLFAFLIILGIVVDDAIVVGENIYVHRRQLGKGYYDAAVDGTRQMTKAVVFAGLTTMAAFGPLLFVGGFTGKFMGVIPIIVISVLTLSLIESFFILPSHLNGKLIKSEARVWKKIERRRGKVDKVVDWFINHSYVGTMTWARENRYLTVAIALVLLFMSVGLIGGGYLKFSFMPDIDSDEVTVNLEMPPGTPFEQTAAIAERIRLTGLELLREYDENDERDESNLRHTFTLYGGQLQEGGPDGSNMRTGGNLAQLYMQFDDPEVRTIETPEFAREWRDRVGELPGVEQLTFRSDLMGSGADMEIQLAHDDFDILLAAVERMKQEIVSFNGTSEVSDSHTEGKREFKLRLKPEAQTLGITETDLAMQVRGAFYGSEALRIQRGKNEVKVMVRYPEEDRETLASLQQMRLRAPNGMEVPFDQAAYVDEGRSYSSITRVDRRRVVNVSANVNSDVITVDEVMGQLRAGIMPTLRADYPGLSFDLEGQSRDQRESMQDLVGAFLTGLLLIYALLAIPFRSFLQPFIVMSAIPFGIVGALLGHLLLGYSMSMISMFGIVALNGVVVNASLVMIDFINMRRTLGDDIHTAVLEAGKRRFRPIVMTALTTFFGLMPMILETSIQARFLIPMAISLGFGVLFATAITLVLVPVLYLILEDIKHFLGIREEVHTAQPVEDSADTSSTSSSPQPAKA